jgi:tetratricopeptide (TPR) repeat protein
MKKIAFLSIALLFAGCNSAPQPVANGNSPVASPERSEKTQTVIAHTTENQPPPMSDSAAPSGPKSKWTQSGDPIDTKEYDDAIAAAEKATKSKPNDTGAKKSLADAYYKRAVALTDARQYAAALGDYRRTVKYDPDNGEAKNWIDQIVGIYDSMNREAPPEGQEPPPLSTKK